LKPESLARVPIEVKWEKGQNEGFIEQCCFMNDANDDAEVFGIADCVISRGNNEVQIANFSPNSVLIEKGNILGYMCNPNSDLNTEKDLSKEELATGKAKFNLIQSILAKTAIIPPSEEEVELSMPVEGGPKTSETPPEVIPSERLLSELHFSESLTSEQRKCLEEIALKHSNAFGLDGRLGPLPRYKGDILSSLFSLSCKERSN
jgi:hypothetical protein